MFVQATGLFLGRRIYPAETLGNYINIDEPFVNQTQSKTICKKDFYSYVYPCWQVSTLHTQFGLKQCHLLLLSSWNHGVSHLDIDNASIVSCKQRRRCLCVCMVLRRTAHLLKVIYRRFHLNIFPQDKFLCSLWLSGEGGWEIMEKQLQGCHIYRTPACPLLPPSREVKNAVGNGEYVWGALT